MVRRIIKEFAIEELSLVMDPAHKDATARIMKSATKVIELKPTETNVTKSFDARVAELRKNDGLSATEAMKQARLENPDVVKAENNLVPSDGGFSAVSAEPVRVAKSAAVLSFEKRVAEVRSVQKCSRTEAIKIARSAYPDEFAAYQQG